MNIAIVTAGGVGSRMGLAVPKQFFEVEGKPLIVYTLERFQRSGLVNAICLVYLDGYKERFLDYIKRYGLTKVRWMTPGGATNQLSIMEGLKCLKSSNQVHDDDIVIVHDGIRPLISEEIIADNIRVCNEKGNAVAVVPSNEAMLISDDSLTSNTSLDRTKVWKTQTPHSMRFRDMLSLLESTVAKGIKNSVAVCTMLIENGMEVHLSKGDNLNFKLTTPEDIDLFRGILESKKKR